jgi:hypothetical protein
MTSKKTWAIPIVAVLTAAIYGGTALATPQQGVTTTLLANKIAFGDIDIEAHTLPADVWQARAHIWWAPPIRTLSDIGLAGG